MLSSYFTVYSPISTHLLYYYMCSKQSGSSYFTVLFQLTYFTPICVLKNSELVLSFILKERRLYPTPSLYYYYKTNSDTPMKMSYSLWIASYSGASVAGSYHKKFPVSHNFAEYDLYYDKLFDTLHQSP